MLAPLGVVQVVELMEFTVLGAVHRLALDTVDAPFCIDCRRSGVVLFKHLRWIKEKRKGK